jgi:hypothetical protein
VTEEKGRQQKIVLSVYLNGMERACQAFSEGFPDTNTRQAGLFSGRIDRVQPASGEGGIRTRGGVTPTQHFQCCTFGRSVTSPNRINLLFPFELCHLLLGKSLAKTGFGKKSGKKWGGHPPSHRRQGVALWQEMGPARASLAKSGKAPRRLLPLNRRSKMAGS